MHIINPIPSGRPIPIMQSLQDAAKLNIQERTTFYVSAFLFQVWVSELSLANTAQMAEQPDPTKRCFQSGQAWRRFQKYSGGATDAELPRIYADLMQFGDCDDPLAAHILESAFPLSIEHELTGDFLGNHTPPALLNQPQQVIALIRSTIVRLCDWLDSALHLRVLQEWHVMPDCFDPDPQKRELACLAINHRHFDQLSEHAQLRFLNHMADAAVEQKNSPNWAAFRHVASNPPPEPRPWPTETLDTAIIKLWPLVKRYGWSPADLSVVLGKVLQAADLGPCPDSAALVSHCHNILGLRWPSDPSPGESPSVSGNQKSEIKIQKSLEIALRLFHVGDDARQLETTENQDPRKLSEGF